MNSRTTKNAETPAPNSKFAIVGVSCSASTFMLKNPLITNLQNVNAKTDLLNLKDRKIKYDR